MENGWGKFFRFLWAFVIIAGLTFGILLAVILKLLSIEPDALWLLIVGAISTVCGGIFANLRPVVDFFDWPFMHRLSSVNQDRRPDSQSGERMVSPMDSQHGGNNYDVVKLRDKIAPRVSLDDLSTWCFRLQDPDFEYDEFKNLGGKSAIILAMLIKGDRDHKLSALISALNDFRSDIFRNDLAAWLAWAQQQDAR